MKTIKIELSEAGLDKLLDKITALQDAMSDLSQPIGDLTQMGEQKAGDILSNALASYDGVRDGAVSSDVNGNSGSVNMDGSSVPFIEFGAGVHYNGMGNYPLPRPAGIVGIGEYGLGQGKQDKWKYGGKWTHGTPAAKPLYFASLEMEQNAPGVFKAVVDDALK